jgi:hypothetical protein
MVLIPLKTWEALKNLKALVGDILDINEMETPQVQK